MRLEAAKVNITVNQKSITAVFNDNKVNNELLITFNAIIDEELKKENPDFDIIDECANAINEIHNEQSIVPAVRLILTKKQVMKYCRHRAHSNNTMKTIVAACMVLIIAGATAYNTSPAFAQNVKSFFATVISTLQNASADTQNDNSKVLSIYASLPDTAKKVVRSVDDVDVSQIKIIAVTSDAEYSVSPSKCKITKTIEHTDKGSFVVVAVSYEGCACTIAFEMEG